MPLLAELNPAQKEAVTWPAEKPLLVIAGAGSGKTRILTRRIAYLISQDIPASQILGVTFTNKAAGEMRQRVQKLVSQEVWINTFHATGLRILRIDGPSIGIDKRFAIYDEQDQLVLIKECLKELQMNERQVHPKGVRERIQRAKDILITPFQYAEKALDLYEEEVAKVYQLYEEKLARLKALDFGDLILKTVSLLDRKPDALESWRQRFRYILIDEYQDTNHAQYRFVKLLADRYKQITVVGDPDQSIYAWRGADIQNILRFERDYPDCGVIRMEQNYRSTAIILDAANGLIAHNRMRKPKSLWTEQGRGDFLSVAECTDEKEEAARVVRCIREACREGHCMGDQVVFYRVHAQSRALEDALRRAKIPYKIVGGVRFYDRREIKDIIAYLRVVAHAHDEVSLKRILNVPPRGIGKKALELLELRMIQEGLGLDHILGGAAKMDSLSPKARTAVVDFWKMMEQFRKDLKRGISLADLLEKILDQTGYVAALRLEKTVEAQSRLENIEEFFSVIQDFEEEEGKSLTEFLESISLMTDLDTWQNSSNVLTLMTLHMAKGLEFPIVYMVGMEEGIFPNANSYTDDAGDLEEERRLCYVGITRAKVKVHLLYAVERRLYGTQQRNLPSRFLHEIPRALVAYETRTPPTFAKSAGMDANELVIDLDDEEKHRELRPS